MSEIVRRDKEELDQISKKFCDEVDKWTDIYQQLRAQADVLNGGQAWIGQVAQAFFTELDELIFPTYDKLLDAFGQACDAMKHINQIFDQGEEDGRACVQNLKL